MTTVSSTNPPLFEHTTCGRCGGSGNYSFNLMYGTRCFGCGGSGFKLTKRGRAAQNFLIELRMVPVGELKVGDMIMWDMLTRKLFGTVEKIEVDASGGFCVTGAGSVGSLRAPASYRVRKGFTADEKRAQIDRALSYQASLTKQGTPSKRAAQAA